MRAEGHAWECLTGLAAFAWMAGRQHPEAARILVVLSFCGFNVFGRGRKSRATVVPPRMA